MIVGDICCLVLKEQALNSTDNKDVPMIMELAEWCAEFFVTPWQGRQCVEHWIITHGGWVRKTSINSYFENLAAMLRPVKFSKNCIICTTHSQCIRHTFYKIIHVIWTYE